MKRLIILFICNSLHILTYAVWNQIGFFSLSIKRKEEEKNKKKQKQNENKRKLRKWKKKKLLENNIYHFIYETIEIINSKWPTLMHN